jgi:COMM domain
MDALYCSLDPKLFRSLLVAITKRSFYGDVELTDDYIADNLYAGVDIDRVEIFSQIASFQEVCVYVCVCVHWAYLNMSEIISVHIITSGGVVSSRLVRFIPQILVKAGEGNWDPAKLEEGLKRSSTINPDHAKVLVAFWSSEREKVHAQLVLDTRWNRSLKSLSWRVDVKATSKSDSEINEPVALFEFVTSAGNPDTRRTISLLA